MSGSFFYSGSGASHCAGAQEQKPGVTGDGVWRVGQWSMKCVWERGPSHCLMSSQRSLSGEQYGSGVSPAALAPTEAPAGHHGTLSSGSSGLPHACASGFRGQGRIPPSEGSDQAHTQGTAYVSRTWDPLCSHSPREASSKFATGMSALAFIKKGQL